MSARRTAGTTLIDSMSAIFILTIGATLLVHHFDHYQAASGRALAVEGVARVLDLELERLRACPDLDCVNALVQTATAAAVTEEGESWVRARVQRSIEAGPGGTSKVIVSADVPDVVRAQTLVSLLWIKP